MLELCRVTTSDGLKLDGSLESDDTSSHARPALLLIHGTGGNFYSGGILSKVADEAVACGFAVLRINTRGHDLVASIPSRKGHVRGGAAYEQVFDCQFDLAAWCDYLVERGHSGIVLVGHSLGGVKAIWSQALAPHSAVAGIIGISPPRFIHKQFQTDPRCAAFRQSFAEAGQLVASGEPDRLITITQPLPLVITAKNFVAKYGPDDPLDYVPSLSRLTCERLMLVGGQSVETNAAFAGLPETFAAAAATDPNLGYAVIDGADINYGNDPIAVWKHIEPWLKVV